MFFNLPIMVSKLAEKIMSKKSPFVILELSVAQLLFLTNLFNQVLICSYQAKQEVMATNKKTTWRKCIGCCSNNLCQAIAKIYLEL
jgi:hypothetical protein